MKKNLIRVLICVLIVCIAVIPVFTAYAEMIYEYYGFQYTLINNYSVSIYGWIGESTDPVIPNSIYERDVVDIGNRAFLGSDITSINLSRAKNLGRIGMFAFKDCENLGGNLTIPENITTIEVAAFQNCDSLEMVYFRAATGTVPSQCFYDCASLSNVFLNQSIEKISGFAFANCPNLTYLEIPASVTSIADTAFQNDDITLGVYFNSVAHQYAENKGIDYVILDPENMPTEPPTEPVTEPEPTDAPTEPAPTDAPTEPVTEPTGYYLGDVNGDDVVNVIDATIIQRYLALLPYPDYCIMNHGDVDGDGITTIIDVTYIRRYVAQFDVEYPIGEWVEP